MPVGAPDTGAGPTDEPGGVLLGLGAIGAAGAAAVVGAVAIRRRRGIGQG
ncbi:hypothetical protein [Pseudonocardia nigra]|nr:hypothetical protein [Pseudonocardia nigra]